MIIITYNVFNIDWGGETESFVTGKSLPKQTTITITFGLTNAPVDYWDHLTAIDYYCYDVIGAAAEEFDFKVKLRTKMIR